MTARLRSFGENVAMFLGIRAALIYTGRATSCLRSRVTAARADT